MYTSCPFCKDGCVGYGIVLFLCHQKEDLFSPSSIILIISFGREPSVGNPAIRPDGIGDVLNPVNLASSRPEKMSNLKPAVAEVAEDVRIPKGAVAKAVAVALEEFSNGVLVLVEVGGEDCPKGEECTSHKNHGEGQCHQIAGDDADTGCLQEDRNGRNYKDQRQDEEPGSKVRRHYDKYIEDEHHHKKQEEHLGNAFPLGAEDATETEDEADDSHTDKDVADSRRGKDRDPVPPAEGAEQCVQDVCQRDVPDGGEGGGVVLGKGEDAGKHKVVARIAESACHES